MNWPSELAISALVRLTRKDLIRHEHFLKDAIASFISFKSYSLFFPYSVTGPLRESLGEDFDKPAFLPREHRLLLPLRGEDGLLGVFVAKGVRLAAPKTMLETLPKAVALILDNLRLRKTALCDPVSGLSNRHHLLAALESEIDRVQSHILPGSAASLEAGPGYSGCLGLVLLDIDYFNWINADCGYVFAEKILAETAKLLAPLLSEESLAARLGEDIFAFLLPGATPAKCLELAEQARAAIKEASFEHPITGEPLRLSLSSGYANYPQDLQGRQLAAPAPEQARVLLKKARKALSVAKDLGRDQVFSHAKILREGGQVLGVLPLSRLTVSLGRSVDASEGQRFLVWSPRFDKAAEIKKSDDQRLLGRYPAMFKAEIILMEVQEDLSFAEVLHLYDASWNIEPGDRLFLATDAEPGLSAPQSSQECLPRAGMPRGLFGHRDFIAKLGEAREKQAHFMLALMRLPENQSERQGRSDPHVEGRIRELSAICREVFGENCLLGRYSTLSLAVYLPGSEPDDVRPGFEDLFRQVARRIGGGLAVGLAGWPFLNFSKADVLEKCRKALEHALLLTEEPKLALFDSISLTISADRLFTLGDVYAAMEEYKLALLADEDNILARNSLGISLARLGRLGQAKAEFERVLARDSKNSMALYNYGYVCQRLGEPELARRALRRCLKLNPSDVFSLMRLGRLAEESGRLALAVRYYNQAAAKSGKSGTAMRHLARLALKRGRLEEAREYLHQALLHDPKDAFSLHHMAKLYLDGGEDPEIAEAMARQSVALRPDQKSFWLELARALEILGKTDEARTARDRAGE